MGSSFCFNGFNGGGGGGVYSGPILKRYMDSAERSLEERVIGGEVAVGLADGSVYEGILSRIEHDMVSNEYSFTIQKRNFVSGPIDVGNISQQIKTEESNVSTKVTIIKNRRNKTGDIYVQVENAENGNEQYLVADGTKVERASGAEMPIWQSIPDEIMIPMRTAISHEYNV